MHINSTSIIAAAAANHVVADESAKYANPSSTHIFVTFVIETSGAWNAQAIKLTQEIGRRTTAVTGNSLETIHLLQRLSIAVQQTNAVSYAAFTPAQLVARNKLRATRNLLRATSIMLRAASCLLPATSCVLCAQHATCCAQQASSCAQGLQQTS